MTMAHAAAAPVGGRLMTPAYIGLLGLVAIAAAILAWRFFFGLGSVTALTDTYPWGIWIAFDVVTGTAIACGGYAVAILVYALNRGKYHPLVRSAILTSALGYTIAGLSVLIDLGRYWNVFGLAGIWNWNLNSILLEVAICITLYVFVAWIELSPAFLERGRSAGNARLRSFSERWLPRMQKALPFLIAFGILLPTMHQSSLGSLMLLAGPKVHALWSTPLLPLLFLITCIAMGYGAVVLESSLSSRAFGRPSEYRLLRPLARIAAGLVALFLVLRVGDLALRGRLGMLLALGSDQGAQRRLRRPDRLRRGVAPLRHLPARDPCGADQTRRDRRDAARRRHHRRAAPAGDLARQPVPRRHARPARWRALPLLRVPDRLSARAGRDVLPVRRRDHGDGRPRCSRDRCLHPRRAPLPDPGCAAAPAHAEDRARGGTARARDDLNLRSTGYDARAACTAARAFVFLPLIARVTTPARTARLSPQGSAPPPPAPGRGRAGASRPA